MKIKLLSKSLIPFKYKTVMGQDFELMVHALEIANNSNNNETIQSISLSLAIGVEKVLTKVLEKKTLKSEIKKIGEHYNQAIGFPESLSIWLSKQVSKKSTCSTKLNLSPKERVIVSNQFFHIKYLVPTKLIVEVEYIEKGKVNSVSRAFSLKEYQLKNKYILPLKGNIWSLWGPTTGSSHHRQTAAQEFAYDFMMFDSKGKIHKNKGLKNSDYYCFKKEIIAPASGKVIIAKDGLAENTKLNETLPLDMEKIKKWGFLHALGGNVIVIEHKNNEYSFIAHCVKGSIKVKEGQRVKQGQPLAQLGNTGNSTAPHLRLFCLWP
jgi:hypothetical protein